MEGMWCPCLVFRLADRPSLWKQNMDILAVVTVVVAGFVLHCWGVLFHFISAAAPRWAVEGGHSAALFLCPPPRRLPLCPRSKRGQSLRGNKSLDLESGSSILNSGRELRVTFPPSRSRSILFLFSAQHRILMLLSGPTVAFLLYVYFRLYSAVFPVPSC